MVPFIDLSKVAQRVRSSVLPGWESAFDKCEFVGGPHVTKLEVRLQELLSVPHAVSCANGTDAIILALQACGVRAGDKVALPNLTFWATYEAVAQLGAVPVLIDIDPNDLQMSFEEFSRAHDKHGFRTALLVHLYGWASHRLADFRTFCRDREIRLIEDGAQSFGTEVDGRSVYADAEIATISFYPAKVVGGAMDGGAVTARDADVAALVRKLANHGRATHYSYSHIGWNSRMGGVQAVYLLAVLDVLPEILESRRRAAGLYRTLLSDVKGLRVYAPPKAVTENGYLQVCTADAMTGDALGEALKTRGIGFARTYPETMDRQPPATTAIRASDLPLSRAFCPKVLNLPLFYGITEDQVRESAQALVEVVHSTKGSS